MEISKGLLWFLNSTNVYSNVALGLYIVHEVVKTCNGRRVPVIHGIFHEKGLPIRCQMVDEVNAEKIIHKNFIATYKKIVII